MRDKLLSYEESVNWLRSDPKYTELVSLCYLDKDILASAQRFFESEEFNDVKKLLKLNNSNSNKKVLDVGCGNGIASFAFACLGHDVTSVDPDISEDVGLGAASRLGDVLKCGSISTCQSFAESLPFKDETFDIVYARQALHHFSDLQKGISECSRVLKKGGLFFATREHVISSEEELNEFLKHHILHQKHGGENAHKLSNYIISIQTSGLTLTKCLFPFDSVINHFPSSNTDIRLWLTNSLENKLGKNFSAILIKLSLVETIYRYRLSKNCKVPGRLHSFLCVKK